MTLPIIAKPEEVTPEWLTAALNAAGVHGRVESFTRESIGTGQVGENVRFSLVGQAVPGSVVGKFPSADPVSKQTGITQQNYVREVYFYRHIRETVDIQTPRVLFADVNEATHDFVILMEDLAPGVQGDQLAGCGADEAALALTELAKLQGPRWGDVSLGAHPLFAGGYSPESASMLKGLYQMLEPGFLERYANRLDSDQARVVHEVGERLMDYHNAWSGPQGFVHIDYRLDNMMFGGPYPLAVVDWQSISLGCPVMDASYFMGTSLDPSVRGDREQGLLRLYLDVLHSYGVEPGFDECFRAYRNYAPAGLIMAVVASMIVGETDRGNDMFMAMAHRSIRMCEDLDTFSV
jgi:hypothetical protein